MHDSNTQAAIQEIQQSQWIRSVDWFDSVDSTNLAAKRAALSGAPVPALYVADRQTSGRGRSDHQWWSPEGCLMLTLAINDSHGPADPTIRPLLALFTGIAVAETLAEWDARAGQPHIELKWPNDVYADRKKISGILIESLTASAGEPIDAPPSPGDSPSKTSWLIGIGINVQMDWSQADPDLRSRATCLATATQRSADRHVVLVQLMERLEFWLARWRDESATWIDAWKHRCLLTGKIIRAQVGAQQIIGLCEGVDTSGRLLVRDQQQLHQLTAAEILDWQ